MPIYREAVIASKRPFRASLKGGVWTVMGSARFENGGVAIIRLNRADARVLSVTHGK
jgi:hypothetical protein